MAEMLNGKHGKTVLIVGTILAAAALGVFVYAIHEGYEPCVIIGGTEISLKKHEEIKQTDSNEKQPPAVVD